MIFLNLALKSLKNRMFTTCLTVLSIALSVALLLSVERTKRSSEEGFNSSVSQVDLIVGARSSPLNLLLYSVFNIGNATNNISAETYEEFKKHPAVEWTIPYSLGDGHRGYRVVGTDANFYEHYRFRGDQKIEMDQGQPALGLWDVVLGAEVADQLHYKLGDKIVVTHGVTRGEGIIDHDDKPFKVVGIMKRTGTSIDRSVYMTLQGLEALHIDWVNGAMPTKDTAIPADKIKIEDIKVDQITSFFLRTKSRIETLRLQRQINEYKEEPLLAIIPGVTLSELWRGLSFVEQTLKAISWMVVFVGLIAMLISLLTSLNERRREMAILRSLGAGPGQIAALLVFESTLLTLFGIALGLALELGGFFILKSWLETELGLYIVGAPITMVELIYLAGTLVLGILIGLVPALRASSLALKDGLASKV